MFSAVKRTGMVCEEKCHPMVNLQPHLGLSMGPRDSLKCANKNTKTWQESGITFGFLPAVTAAGGLPGLGCTLQKGEDTWKRAHRGTD